MTRVTLETEWGTSDDVIVTKEVNEDDLDVHEMLNLMIDVMKGFGYQEDKILSALDNGCDEYAHWRKNVDS